MLYDPTWRRQSIGPAKLSRLGGADSRAQPRQLRMTSDIETRIDCWVSHWNDNPEPSAWTKLADEILTEVARGRATLDWITKSGTHR